MPANKGDARDAGSILGSQRSPGGGNGDPLQYSSLENPKDREAWQATVHGVTKSQIQQSDSTHTDILYIICIYVKNITSYNSIKNIKYLGIDLIKYVQDVN